MCAFFVCQTIVDCMSNHRGGTGMVREWYRSGNGKDSINPGTYTRTYCKYCAFFAWRLHI